MKRIFITFLSLAMLVLCVSCSEGNIGDSITTNGRSTTRTTKNTNPTQSTTREDNAVTTDMSTVPYGLTPEEIPATEQLTKEYEQFIQNIKTLKAADTARKIELVSVAEYQSYNSRIISQWITLLEHMKVTAIPNQELYGGMRYNVTFTTNIEEISIGSYYQTHEYIYLNNGDKRKVMFRIDNYKEIEDEFIAAEKAIVFEKTSE